MSVVFGLVASAVGIVFTVQAERSSDKALNTWIPAGKSVNQPPTTPTGPSTLVVIANGIASPPVPVTIR